MNKLSKLFCSIGLTAAVFAGTVLAGCAESTNYTEEIKEYQAKLEALQAENEELRSQIENLSASKDLELPTQSTQETVTETAAESSEASVSENSATASVSENSATAAAQTESPAESSEAPVSQEQTAEDEITRILVFGDSIWGNYRDGTGVAAKVVEYGKRLGKEIVVYNAAIGGTRATLDPEDNEYVFGPASESSLAKMVSILNEETSVDLLEGKAAYEDMKQVLSVRGQIDVVILAYGLNDFFNQVPINNSDDPWTGFGTAMVNGILGIRRACPQTEIMIIAPNYASYFSIPVQNMGEKALYNYASVACDVARGAKTLCMDAYNNMGIDAYNADEYLEDGVHLNEKGRDLYARHVVSCLFYGKKGQISGNAYDFDQNSEG